MITMRPAGHVFVASLLLVACSGKDSGAGSAGAAGSAAGGSASISGGTISGTGKGFRFTMTGTSETPGLPGQANGPQPTTTTVRVLEGKARIDFAQGAAPGLKNGGWMLVESGASRMSIVDPAAKTVTVIDSLGSLGGMAGMQGMMQVTVKDTSSTVEDLGAGETFLGFGTHKYRITIGYTMDMSIMGRTMPMRTEQVTVAQMSDDVGLLEAGFDLFEKSFRSSMGGLTGSEAASTIKALNDTRPKGFPLMQEMTSHVIRGGDTTTTRSSFRVTELTRGGVSDADFTVPADYARTDVGAAVRGVRDKASEATRKAGGAAERMRRAVEAAESGRPAVPTP